MDRQFSTPRALAGSSPEEIQRALRRVLSGLQDATEFLYEAEFAFANGRKAPVLMVGALRGAWRDYIRRNAAAAGFCAGACHPRRGDDGRLVLELVPVRGRARGGSHSRTINLSLIRGLGEVRFVDAATDASAAAPPPASAAAQSAPPPGDAAPDADALLAAFAAFKAAPTASRLDALLAGIAAWRAAGGGGEKAAQIEKIAALLADKGRAYVAAKSG